MVNATNIIQFPVRRVSGIELMQAVDREIARSKPAKAPKASDDRIFAYIAHHRHAVLTDNVTDATLYMRCLIVGGATTRKGTIALAKYLAEQLEVHAETGGGIGPKDCLEDGKRWITAFMNTLARELRRMGSEFPAAGRRPNSPRKGCRSKRPPQS